VPVDASVGSAVGFLRAPVAFEIVRSLRIRDDDFLFSEINDLLEKMQSEATTIVAAGAMGAKLQAHRAVEMRYEGQGHEISISLPAGGLKAAHAGKLRKEYEARYERQFGLKIANVPVEFLTWSVNVSTLPGKSSRKMKSGKRVKAVPSGKRSVFDPAAGKKESISIYSRTDLAPGMQLTGPALVVEPQTTTLVPRGWSCNVAAMGHLILERRK
jgi:N-methylhydantoinase A